ncbi:hypothetical protein [Sphingobium jiangsuense]|nr:hypothetical protein [Sphingobium jiangsuense]
MQKQRHGGHGQEQEHDRHQGRLSDFASRGRRGSDVPSLRY